jgi:hypothetical protein
MARAEGEEVVMVAEGEAATTTASTATNPVTELPNALKNENLEAAGAESASTAVNRDTCLENVQTSERQVVEEVGETAIIVVKLATS